MSPACSFRSSVRPSVRLSAYPLIRPSACPPFARPLSASARSPCRSSVSSLVRYVRSSARPTVPCPPYVCSFRSSVRPSVRPSVCPHVRPSARPSVSSVRLSACPLVRPSARPLVRPSACPRLRLSVCSSSARPPVRLSRRQEKDEHVGPFGFLNYQNQEQEKYVGLAAFCIRILEDGLHGDLTTARKLYSQSLYVLQYYIQKQDKHVRSSARPPVSRSPVRSPLVRAFALALVRQFACPLCPFDRSSDCSMSAVRLLFPFVRPSVRPSVRLSACPPVRLSVRFFCPSVRSSARPLVLSAVRLSALAPVRLQFVRTSACPLVPPSRKGRARRSV